MNSRTVLICDDNESIHTSMRSYLCEDQINVVSVYDGMSAVDTIRNTHIDILLLDIMMPGIDGIEVCRRIRKFSQVYIMILSAKNEEADRILGLETGADDYVAKPFSPREISIRIKKALDRMYPPENQRLLEIADLRVYPESGQVFVSDKELRLSSKEITVLSYMVKNAGKILSREGLLNAAWGYDYFGDTRVVDTMIKTLRKKVLQESKRLNIMTIYGSGYKLTENL